MLIRSILTAIFLILFGHVLFNVMARRDYRNRGKLSALTSTLEFVIFALHANSMYMFLPTKWPNLPALSKDPAIYIISLALIIIGLAIVLGAMIPLGYNRTMGLKSRDLMTRGFYRYTRNPQLIGYYLILIGVAVSYPSLYSLGWLVVFGIITHFMITAEEEYLHKIYGEKYKDYCGKVPRLFNLKVFLPSKR